MHVHVYRSIYITRIHVHIMQVTKNLLCMEFHKKTVQITTDLGIKQKKNYNLEI